MCVCETDECGCALMHVGVHMRMSVCVGGWLCVSVRMRMCADLGFILHRTALFNVKRVSLSYFGPLTSHIALS